MGIPEATYRLNKKKPHWKEFREAIRRGRAEGNCLVFGKNYEAASSATDVTRAAARALHARLSGVHERVDVNVKGKLDNPAMAERAEQLAKFYGKRAAKS